MRFPPCRFLDLRECLSAPIATLVSNGGRHLSYRGWPGYILVRRITGKWRPGTRCNEPLTASHETECRTTGRRASAAAAMSRTAAAAAASSYTACDPARLEPPQLAETRPHASSSACNQPQPPALALPHVECCVHRRARCASGAPPWRRPALAATAPAALPTGSSLAAPSARCGWDIGQDRRGRPHEPLALPSLAGPSRLTPSYIPHPVHWASHAPLPSPPSHTPNHARTMH